MSEEMKKFFDAAGIDWTSATNQTAKRLIEEANRPILEYISFENIQNVEGVMEAFREENVIVDIKNKVIIAIDRHEQNDWIRSVLTSLFAEERGLEVK